MLDAGIPDGAMLSAVYRPWRWARVHAGAGSNTISAGMRAGVVLVPFTAGPSLTVEGGWYFEGDASGIVTQVTGNQDQTAMAHRLGYQFANFHLGLELGGESVFFFLHGGASYLRSEIHQTNQVFGGRSTDAQGNVVTTFTITRDPVVTAWVPSAKCGLVFFFV
jgi:hypothetical protein